MQELTTIWSILCVLVLSVSTAKIPKVHIQNGYDPGKCNSSKHGNLQLVKDREDNEKLLVCSKENGAYTWKTTDGSDSLGELFNPGFDCSHILDKRTQAEDGFYWVNFNKQNIVKVWCDMATDGGGYMLIGRKTSPETWSIPSKDTPVHPFGKPQWSSSLGDAPILDFRIHVSGSEKFQDILAHWSYRLRQTRPLKELLVEVGCGKRSPGVGDIAYVKDLQTDKIVNTNFRCSKFGPYHKPSEKSGWTMMNSCLRKACPNGFGFHEKYPVQTDRGGSFSYTTNGKTSGQSDDSTAFIGCDNGLCCGCFGPRGKTGSFCGSSCTAKNGGTVRFSGVYTWYWVRSSLPKKVWSKCMEYSVMEENGSMKWFKLIGGSSTPMEGKCQGAKALLNEGIVVVPDAEAAKRIPSIPGLLQYRKESGKLYVRVNETWNVLGEGGNLKEIKEINTEIAQIKAQSKTDFTKIKTALNTLNKTISNIFPSSGGLLSQSVILLGEPMMFRDYLIQWIPKLVNSTSLCWQATRDGWNSSTFHSNCDYLKPTLTIVKANEYIFGGYTEDSWDGYSYKSSSGSFLFSLRNKDNLPPFKSPRIVSKYSYWYWYWYRYDIYASSYYGPTFGGGHDLRISNNAGSNNQSYTNFGQSYQLPSGYSYGSSRARALLAGTYNFQPSEVEVFYLR